MQSGMHLNCVRVQLRTFGRPDDRSVFWNDARKDVIPAEECRRMPKNADECRHVEYIELQNKTEMKNTRTRYRVIWKAIAMRNEEKPKMKLSIAILDLFVLRMLRWMLRWLPIWQLTESRIGCYWTYKFNHFSTYPTIELITYPTELAKCNAKFGKRKRQETIHENGPRDLTAVILATIPTQRHSE